MLLVGQAVKVGVERGISSCVHRLYVEFDHRGARKVGNPAESAHRCMRLNRRESCIETSKVRLTKSEYVDSFRLAQITRRTLVPPYAEVRTLRRRSSKAGVAHSQRGAKVYFGSVQSAPE